MDFEGEPSSLGACLPTEVPAGAGQLWQLGHQAGLPAGAVTGGTVVSLHTNSQIGPFLPTF